MMQTNELSTRSVLIISDLDIWSMGQNVGGPALSQTLRGYAKQGWKVVFLTGNRCPHNQEYAGIHVVRFDAPRVKSIFKYRHIGFCARLLWWLIFQLRALAYSLRLQRAYRFNIVYGYEIMGVPIAKCLSRLWNIPMVARFQGTSFGVGWPTKWVRYIKAWDHWLALSIPADLTIMTNDGTQGDRVLRDIGADMTKVRFWMNGIDKDRYENMCSKEVARARLGLKDSAIILTVSRLVKWKRVDRAIRTLPEVLARIPNVQLVIVGDGEEKSELMQLTREIGIADNVMFVGKVPHNTIRDYMIAADLFLSLYSWSNLGNPLLEAMLAAKCIVTLGNGDTARFLSNRVNSILLEEEDLSGLSDIVVSLLRDTEIASRLGLKAREYALSELRSWDERMSSELEEVSRLVKSD